MLKTTIKILRLHTYLVQECTETQQRPLNMLLRRKVLALLTLKQHVQIVATAFAYSDCDINNIYVYHSSDNIYTVAGSLHAVTAAFYI